MTNHKSRYWLQFSVLMPVVPVSLKVPCCETVTQSSKDAYLPAGARANLGAQVLDKTVVLPPLFLPN